MHDVIQRVRVWSAVNDLGGQMTPESALQLKDVPTRYALFNHPVSIIKPAPSFTCVFHTETLGSRHSTLFIGSSECPYNEYVATDEPDQAVRVMPMNGRKTLALFPSREYALASYAITMRDGEEMKRKLRAQQTVPEDWVPVSTHDLLSRSDTDTKILADSHMLRVVEKAAPTMAWSDPELCALLSPHTLHVPVCLTTWRITVALLSFVALLLFPSRSLLVNAGCTRRTDAANDETPCELKKRKMKKKKKTLPPVDLVETQPIDQVQETGRSVVALSPSTTEDVASVLADQVARRLDEFRAPLDRPDADKTLITKMVAENTELRDTVRGAQNEVMQLRTKIFEFSRAIAQFHFYFTDTHPRRWSHLESLSDDAGYVEMDTVLGFELMASHAVTRSEMAFLLAKSPVVEVAACGTLVRSRRRFATQAHVWFQSVHEPLPGHLEPRRWWR